MCVYVKTRITWSEQARSRPYRHNLTKLFFLAAKLSSNLNLVNILSCGPVRCWHQLALNVKLYRLGTELYISSSSYFEIGSGRWAYDTDGRVNSKWGDDGLRDTGNTKCVYVMTGRGSRWLGGRSSTPCLSIVLEFSARGWSAVREETSPKVTTVKLCVTGLYLRPACTRTLHTYNSAGRNKSLGGRVWAQAVNNFYCWKCVRKKCFFWHTVYALLKSV